MAVELLLMRPTNTGDLPSCGDVPSPSAVNSVVFGYQIRHGSTLIVRGFSRLTPQRPSGAQALGQCYRLVVHPE